MFLYFRWWSEVLQCESRNGGHLWTYISGFSQDRSSLGPSKTFINWLHCHCLLPSEVKSSSDESHWVQRLANDRIVSEWLFPSPEFLVVLFPCPLFIKIWVDKPLSLNSFPVRWHSQQFKQLVVRLPIDQAHQSSFQQLFSFLTRSSIFFHCELDLHSCAILPLQMISLLAARSALWGKEVENNIPSGISVVQTFGG